MIFVLGKNSLKRTQKAQTMKFLKIAKTIKIKMFYSKAIVCQDTISVKIGR